ncbi:helix-turn-helix domain-containing protein [Cytophaga sp. FL35]|uniref:helix-turn-helix domain-containing protein n=1 Tax=Cytophaga sp. FL35 TaxID=1904456 RepID=UPI001653B6C1|nr:helix-turn-helix domain-containing protein [Cytophaga sp. FL35]MBC6999678.1 helix-turn-helix domain-containing protein [Cytophaga sp. FL35]
MSGTIQFINTTPDELLSAVDQRLEGRLKKLAENFQPKEPTEYLTRHEVANLLKVDVSSVHNYTKKGLLTSYGLSGRVYYKRSEVESALIQLNK